MLSVKTNLLAMNANRQLGINTKKNTKITEKLSSGYKINRAADDAAGLAISEKMRRQIRGLCQGAENIKDGIGYVQTAEGALNEVHDMLQRINELSVKAANGTWTEEDRSYIDSEVQALKKEIDRIFDTTSFNERKIWDYGPGKQEPDVTYRYENAITFPNPNSYPATSVSVGVTNANCGVLAVSEYKFQADDNGVVVKWTGYDGKKYQTQPVTWEELENNNYSFKMEDYFGDKNANNKLYTYNAGTGDYEPVFNKTVSFTVNPDPNNNRTLIKNSINTATMRSSVSVSMSVDDNDSYLLGSNGNSESEVYVHNVNLTYAAAYLSWEKSSGDDGHDFDNADDDFIVPNPAKNLTSPSPIITDVNAAKQSDARWSFSFNMEGIGSVTAESTNVSFYSYDGPYYETEDKDVWWYYYTVNGKQEQTSTSRSGVGNLKGVMAGLTGVKNGLLAKPLGWSDRDGYIDLSFSITPDNKNLTYGEGSKLTQVGSFTLRIPVYTTDDESTVLQRINDALNSNTTLDFHTTSKSNDGASIGNPKGTSEKVSIPIYPDGYVDEPYDDTQRFFVQAGAEAGQHIDIEYEFLSLDKIGLKETNTLTEEDAGNAINEVKAAMEIVSKQRSDFGAYQNRLEHAYNINNNTVENTQAAESLIRDTDIADAMMEYSVNNILMQAGVSMLTQANQLPNSIIELLNA